MKIEEQKKLAGHIMRLLKVRSVSFPIAATDKGNLFLKYIGDQDFEMVLDAVPLSIKSKFDDENNIELKGLLEKYWFESGNFSLPPHNMDGASDVKFIIPIERIVPKNR